MDRRIDDPTLKDAQIVLKLPESFSKEALNLLVKDINAEGIKTAVITRPDIEIYAGFEWIKDGAMALLLLDKLFGGIFEEAGKDVYQLVKSWLKKAATDARNFQVRLMASSQSTQKLSSSYTQSHSFTPKIQLKSGLFIKLLFDERLSNEDWEAAIEQMFVNMRHHYENYPNDNLSQMAADLTISPRHNTLYAIIDIDTKQWMLHNDYTMTEMERNKTQ